MTKKMPQAPHDQLLTRMRRLSIGSDGSAFSLLSAAPTARSLGSTDSTAGGVMVGTPSVANGSLTPVSIKPVLEGVVTSPRSKKTTKRKKSTSQQPQQPPSPTLTSTTTTAAKQRTPSPLSKFTSQQQTDPHRDDSCSTYWTSFAKFTPDPRALFKDEFARLVKHQGWGTKTKRKQQVDALTAEINFHYGTCLDKLARWQELCRDVGIEGDMPGSIRACKKELKHVLVNINNLIDHLRNEEVKLLSFKSYGDFCRYTLSHPFPKDCAKKDGFVRVLLKKV